MPSFPYFELTHYQLAGENIGVDTVEKALKIGGEPVTPERWVEIVAKVQRVMEHEGWVEKKGKFDNASSKWEGASSNFMANNIRSIIERTRGYIKDAPFWLRPFYSGVVTKEQFHD